MTKGITSNKWTPLKPKPTALIAGNPVFSALVEKPPAKHVAKLIINSAMSKKNRLGKNGQQKKRKKGRCPKCKSRTWNGKFCEAKTDCPYTEKKQKQTPRQRLFTNEFNVDDKVFVIRTDHGWYDGSLEATIKELGSHSCVVVDEDGIEYDIDHPRDIYK